ncbi:nucleotidyltransferase family protein [Antribacter gilvus]|uniref:nucleotidyltransferase family protein n=1 Tax=Antribacter gilvus TaxID=2304675 RepID=UPI000F7A0AC2|nr:NTP transferase domain-containing protein [Antribacter gilvus]
MPPLGPGSAGPAAVGLVLAAGAGSRYGTPKALVRAADGVPWVELACRALRDGGCADVLVVLGASAAEALPLVPSWARPVVAAGWARGVAASLRTGLAACAATPAACAVVTLVDLPGLRPEAVARLLAMAPAHGPREQHEVSAGGGAAGTRLSLARATYGGRPGHPVLLGRSHWAAVSAEVRGDVGAGPYLRTHGALDVDCTDLGGGDDVDVPAR